MEKIFLKLNDELFKDMEISKSAGEIVGGTGSTTRSYMTANPNGGSSTFDTSSDFDH